MQTKIISFLSVNLAPHVDVRSRFFKGTYCFDELIFSVKV